MMLSLLFVLMQNIKSVIWTLHIILKTCISLCLLFILDTRAYFDGGEEEEVEDNNNHYIQNLHLNLKYYYCLFGGHSHCAWGLHLTLLEGCSC